jgi:hypothetical protein
VVTAAVAPRVPQARRATDLSLQSLAGTLVWSAFLFGLARLAGPSAANDPATLAALLRSAVLVAGPALVALAVFRRGADAMPAAAGVAPDEVAP